MSLFCGRESLGVQSPVKLSWTIFDFLFFFFSQFISLEEAEEKKEDIPAFQNKFEVLSEVCAMRVDGGIGEKKLCPLTKV